MEQEHRSQEGFNTVEFLEIAAGLFPDREAMVWQGERIDYQTLRRDSANLSFGLRDMGLRPGDKLAAMATNSPRFVEAYYACARLGVTFVPINYRAKREELDYMLENSEASFLFYDRRYEELIDESSNVQRKVCLDSGDSEFRALHERGEMDHAETVPANGANLLIYTSGTTGKPKAATITNKGLAEYVFTTNQPNIEEQEVQLVAVPFFHIAGATTMLSSIFAGRKMVTMPQFDPEMWLRSVQNEKATHSFLVPKMVKDIIEHPAFGDYDLSSLRLITYGAAPMPYPIVLRAIQSFDCDLMNAYGQTEATSTLTFLSPDDHRIDESLTSSEKEKKLYRLRSVGRPMPDIRLGIVDSDGNPLSQGKEGEVVAWGNRIMAGYHNANEASQKALEGGALHTGDVGYLDEDGYLFITGRSKDLIIRGGENISPGEVEAILHDHPQVEEAAVVGVPDEDWGEIVKAFIVAKKDQAQDAQGIIDFCKERLASYKTPEIIHFLEALPRNHLGKILKEELKRIG